MTSNIWLLHKSVCLEFVLEDDGTDVDDDEVLLALPPHTTLMVLHGDQKWGLEAKNTVDNVERVLTALLNSNHRRKVTELITERLHEGTDQKIDEILGQIVSSMEQNIQATSRLDDPEWFKDQPASRNTKEAVMRECAKRRLRNYYHTAMDHVKSKKKKISSQYQEILDCFQTELKDNGYYGDYFDRSLPAQRDRICDSHGWFHCEGAYDADGCSYGDHRINPYGSRNNYIVFSTWNLDHRIEKSREILPQLLIAQDKKPKSKDLNWHYFYDLLFTRNNLRLVHTSCHDKTEHTSEKCDHKLYYL